MKYEQFYSSSNGNLYIVTASNGKRLLLECGVTWKKIQRALHYNLKDIEACLLTHEHKDHCKAVKEVMQAGIDVYASDGTLGILCIKGHRKTSSIYDNNILKSFSLGDFSVMPFPLHHDAKDPLGYIIKEKDSGVWEHRPDYIDRPVPEYMLFAPDTSHITQRFNIQFNIIAIECSYDIHILQDRVERRDINQTLATRLLTSHMEKQVTMKYLAEFCDLSKCREIHLLHMSNDNIDKEQTKKEFEERFFIETITS